MSFQFTRSAIPDVVVVKPDIYPDSRGIFLEGYKKSSFAKWGIAIEIQQVSQSDSKKNVLRGLHYQLNPKAQGKLVQVIVGKVFDVAVDIRHGSPFYGQWVGQVLSAEERTLFWVPEGFAHGYCALSESAQMVYYCTEEWAPDCERGILWNDPLLSIDWPVKKPIIAPKDQEWPLLEEADNNFIYKKKD